MSSDNPNKIIADVDGTQATVKDFGDGDPRLGVHMLTSLSAHATTHRPDDSDGLVVGSPDDLAAGDSSAEGSANAFVRQDHQHGVPVAAPDDLAVGDTAAVGSATNLVRSDHQHGVPAVSPDDLAVGDTASVGVGTSFVRNDHQHGVPAAAPGNLSAGGSAAIGSGTSFVRNDHQHGAPAAAPDDLAVGDTAAEGVGTSFVRNDHQHGVPAAAPANLGAGDTAAAGSGTNFVRNDHQHGVPVGAPSSIGTANAEGSSTDLVRKDHVHDGTHEVTSSSHTSTETNEDYFLKPDGSGGVEWGSIDNQKVGFLALKALAGTIAKGTPVYAYDYSSDYRVESAEADIAAKMPCVGLAYEQLDTSTAKRVITHGTLMGIDTSLWSVGDVLYVDVTAGQLTSTRPSDTKGAYVQAVATVLRSDASVGCVLVHSIGHSEDVPNFHQYTEISTPNVLDLLLINDADDNYEPKTTNIQEVLALLDASDLSVVSITRTSAYTVPSGGSWGTPTFDTQLEENDSDIIEWTATASTRITVKEAGMYALIAVASFDGVHTASFNSGGELRFSKNGTAVTYSNVHDVWHYSGSTSNFYGGHLSTVFPITLAADDYIEINLRRTDDASVGTITAEDIIFAIVRLAGKTGAQGDQGPTGADGDITWEGTWSSSTTYYTNEAVFYQGSTYVCIATTTNNPPVSSPTYWELMTQGMRPSGDWSGSTTYYPGDVVAHDMHSWLCIYSPSHSGQEPPNSTYWLQLARGFNWLGQWSSGTTYNEGDCVFNDGAAYYCTSSHTNQEPPNATYWDSLLTGVVFGNEYQSNRSDSESSTTSDTYQEKVPLTTTILAGGTYRIEWFFEHAMGGDDKQFGFRVQLDDTTTMTEGIIECKGQYNDSQWRSVSGWDEQTLSAASHDIDLDYRDVGAGDTAYIRRARVALWRVS